MQTTVRSLAAATAALAITATSAQTQPVPLATEYIMSIEVALDSTYRLDAATVLAPGKPGGYVRGPKIEGRFIGPGGDWARVMPSGVMRLDVRATIQTKDNAMIYVSYNGLLRHSPESLQRLQRGETLQAQDVPYYIVAPTFQTAAEPYGWLNTVQAVAKMTALKLGENGFVRYDVFAVR